MKYIVFKRIVAGLEHLTPVVFPNHMVHRLVADDLLKGSLRGWTADSAGSVSVLDCSCSGKSETLGLEANKERDTRLLSFNDYNAGLV